MTQYIHVMETAGGVLFTDYMHIADSLEDAKKTYENNIGDYKYTIVLNQSTLFNGKYRHDFGSYNTINIDEMIELERGKNE